MTQKATSSMIFADPNDGYRVQIGTNSQASNTNATAVGASAKAPAFGSSAFGANAKAQGKFQLAIGYDTGSGTADASTHIGYGAKAAGKGSVALGAYSGSTSLAAGAVDIGTRVTDYGYNSSNYRLLTGLYDAQSDHDAVNLGQLNSRVLAGGTTAPTTSTVGAVGALYAYVSSGTGHLAICTDDTGGTYTWQTLV